MANPTIPQGGSMGLTPGPYPGLFHVIDFSERVTSGGPEATVTFEGPSDRRFDLINAIFPYWGVTHNGTTNICCPFLVSPPVAYPDLANARSGISYPPDMEFDEPFTVKTPGICEQTYDTLWPDTYTIRAGSRTCRPQRWPCTNAEDLWPTEPSILQTPLYFAEPDGESACSCIIEVNYRRRYHATWPSIFRSCGDDDLWKLPDVPLGTYIEVRTDPTVNFKTVQGRELKYDNSEWFIENDYGTAPCEGMNTVVGKEWEYCKATGLDGMGQPIINTEEPASLIVGSELKGGQIINSSSIEITWSGVPVPPLKNLDSLKGKVNYYIFLGYPPESVLFESYNVIPRGNFGVFDLYDIVINLSTLTSPVSANFDMIAETDADVIKMMLFAGVFNGQIGMWNRLWSNNPLRVDINGDGEKVMCTNWSRVENNTLTCCESSASGDGNSLYKFACFQGMFDLGGVCP